MRCCRYLVQYQTFGQGAEEQVLVRVRPGSLFAPSVPLHDHSRGGSLREQGGVDDVDLVSRVCITGHECEHIIASHQSYLDVGVVDQESILREQVHMS